MADPEFEQLLASLPADFLCPVVRVDGVPYPLVWKIGGAQTKPTPNEPGQQYQVLKCRGDGNCLFHAFLRVFDPYYIRSFNLHPSISESTLNLMETEIQQKIVFPPNTLSPDRNVQVADRYNIINRPAYDQVMATYRVTEACLYREKLARYVLKAPEIDNILQTYFQSSLVITRDQLKEAHSQASINQLNQSALLQVKEDLAKRIAGRGVYIEPEIVLLLSALYNLDIYLLSNNKLEDPRAKHPFVAEFYLTPVRGPSALRTEQLQLADRQAAVLLYSGGNEGHYDVVVKTTAEPGNYVTLFNPDEPLIINLYLQLTAARWST